MPELIQSPQSELAAAADEGPVHPITAAAAVHRVAHATYMAALDRANRLLEEAGIDLNLIGESDEILRPLFMKAYGWRVDIELARYHVAQEICDNAGNREDEAQVAFEAIGLKTTKDVKAYQAYMFEHEEVVSDGEGSVLLHRMANRLADLLCERLAA